jgi:hypothetical protein
VELYLYFPVCLHEVDRDFSHLSYARYMQRPSRNEVAKKCEAPVIQISACCYLPGLHIQPPHHSALQAPHSASPAHHVSLFIVITTMPKDSFNFHTLQVSPSFCNLLSPICILTVHTHTNKACRRLVVQRHTFLRWH